MTASQNVGFRPHLGGKGFNTVPVLDVSSFLPDFVHKIHRCLSLWALLSVLGATCIDPTYT